MRRIFRSSRTKPEPAKDARFPVLIYTIRHGQTNWNAEGRLQGARDIPLNELGRDQARDNGRALKAMLADAAGDYGYVSSPLSRAQETMQLLREAMDLEPETYRTDGRLIEISFGDWEGHTLAEVEEFDAGANERREADKWHFLPPGDGAESYQMMEARIRDWLGSLAGPTVCVAHGGVIRALMRIVARIPPEEAANAPIPQNRILRVTDTEAVWLQPDHSAFTPPISMR